MLESIVKQNAKVPVDTDYRDDLEDHTNSEVRDEGAFDVGKDSCVRVDLSQDMAGIDFESSGWLNIEQTPYGQKPVFGSLAPHDDTVRLYNVFIFCLHVSFHI